VPGVSDDLTKARDFDGKLITELPTQEIKRRLSIIRNEVGTDHFMSRYYKRIYEAVIAERETSR
jgi:hypothetical protein